MRSQNQIFCIVSLCGFVTEYRAIFQEENFFSGNICIFQINFITLYAHQLQLSHFKRYLLDSFYIFFYTRPFEYSPLEVVLSIKHCVVCQSICSTFLRFEILQEHNSCIFSLGANENGLESSASTGQFVPILRVSPFSCLRCGFCS